MAKAALSEEVGPTTMILACPIMADDHYVHLTNHALSVSMCTVKIMVGILASPRRWFVPVQSRWEIMILQVQIRVRVALYSRCHIMAGGLASSKRNLFRYINSRPPWLFRETLNWRLLICPKTLRSGTIVCLGYILTVEKWMYRHPCEWLTTYPNHHMWGGKPSSPPLNHQRPLVMT